MDLSYLEKLVQLFDESTLTELEIDEEGSQIRLARTKEAPQQIQYAYPPQGYGSFPMNQQGPAPAGSSEATNSESARSESTRSEAASATGKKLHEVKSPIVGTLYRAPAPDADTYVQVGQHVEVGTTLCIIEAMKLMNEIESDASGMIVKILVENGQPVEYGQVLFLLEE